MADTIQRVKYYPNQFLQVDDFTDEQTYHMRMRRKHNIVLHKPGIAEGLEVKALESKAATIEITRGVAIDEEGCEIVLDAAEEKKLSKFPDNAVVYVTIRYNEEKSATVGQKGVNGSNRLTEKPIIELLDQAPQNPGIQLLLAVVTLDGSAVVQAKIDTAKRQLVGVKADDLSVQSLKFKLPSLDRKKWPQMTAGDKNKAEITDSLNVKAGLFKVEASAQIDKNVQIGTNEKDASLDVLGSLTAKKIEVDGTIEQCFSSEWFWVDSAPKPESGKSAVLSPINLTNPLGEIPSGFQMFYVYRDEKKKDKYPTDNDPQYLVNTMVGNGENGYQIKIKKETFEIFPGQSIAIYLDDENKPKQRFHGYYRLVCWKKKEIQKDLLVK